MTTLHGQEIWRLCLIEVPTSSATLHIRVLDTRRKTAGATGFRSFTAEPRPAPSRTTGPVVQKQIISFVAIPSMINTKAE